MATPHAHLILNPTSGRGKARTFLAQLQKRPELLLGGEYTLHVTRGPGHGVELAQQAVAAGAELVIAAGGDGTLHEVVNGLMAKPGPALGLIPVGTGNDLARTLGLSEETALAKLAEGKTRPLDVGILRNEKGQTYFVNIAGVGFDAAVARRINQGYRRLTGTTAYIAAVLEVLRRYRALPIRVTVDGEAWESRAMLCAVANAQSYGGGMRVAPDARVDDGLFDVVLLSEVSRFEFLRQFPKVFAGKHVSHPAVRVVRGRSVRIETEVGSPVLVDGELVGETPAEFGIEVGRLRVVA